MNSSLPHAIVIGLDCMTGLQTARILAGHGVPVIGVAKSRSNPCVRTRCCERIVFCGDELLISTLLDVGRSMPQKATLFPCTDEAVRAISEAREQLQPYFAIDLPEREIVDTLMDKVRFCEFAQRNDLPVPATFLLRNRADAELAAASLSYPCMLKPPMRTPLWERNAAKVYKLADAASLLRTYDQVAPFAELLIAQQWIPGNDSALYSCNAYFDKRSNPLVTFVARKLRQWPPEAGTSCLGEECRDDIVLDTTIRLFQLAGFTGLAYLEMKKDAQTGEHFIIEPNIGRPTGRSAIAEAGGVELLYTKYCYNAGLPLPEKRLQTYRGVKWIHYRRDLQSAVHYWRTGELTLRQWWSSWRGRKRDALFSWNDPVPFVLDLKQAAGKFLSRAKE